MDVTNRPEYKDLAHMPGQAAFIFATGLLAAVVLYCTGTALGKSYGAAIFCSPFFLGAIVGVINHARPVRRSLQTLGIGLAIAVLTLREGVVCCLMALPFITPVTIVGALTGSTIRRYFRGRRARAVLSTLLMLTAVTWQAVEGGLDDPKNHPLHHARSAIVIPAEPQDVFATLAGPGLEVRPDWPWFLRIGLPMPTRLRVEPPVDGGRVTATFSHGTARGHVTDWQPGRLLAYSIDRYEIADLPFHITRLGRSPDYGFRPERIEDWLTIVSTRFELHQLAGGQTELRREIVWRRHLAPAFYFGWLQQVIIERSQDRLLSLIRERVPEKRQPSRAAETLVARIEP